MHSLKQGIPVHKSSDIVNNIFPDQTVIMWQRLAAKWSAKTPEVFRGDIIDLPLWTKQRNILLSSKEEWISFSVLAARRRRDPSKCRRTEAGARSLRSFFGLFRDHVARRGHWAAAIWLLLLGWFQNLKGAH